MDCRVEDKFPERVSTTNLRWPGTDASGTAVRAAHYRGSYNLYVNADFLDRLTNQLRANKSAACRRAIQRILAVVKKNFEDGKYKNDVEAEADFRQLADRDEGCK
jgi:hypothetical protein